MNSIKKITIVGCTLLASTALLVSFTKGNDDDKKKKYQIIHHANGEVITYDTILPMSSSLTPEQYVAEMGISNENIDVINIPAISELEHEGKMMRTFVHEVDIEDDGNGSEETVEIRVEMDENGEMKTKKTVNGVEVEMTEDELTEIKSQHGDHGKMIKVRIDDEEIGEMDERVEISVEIDDEGNKTVKKVVNGEEVEMTEEEMDRLQLFETMDEDNMNVFIHMEEMEGDMEGMQMEIERLIEEGGDDVKILTKRIEINSESEGDEFEFESEDGNQRIMLMSSGDTEDHTIVLVTEDYDEATSNEAKIMFESSSEGMDVYPNPNDGTFKIRYESDEKKKTAITVTDASGKKVFEEDLGKFSGSYEKELNLKKFGSGMYTITIQNGNNEDVQKVMIK